jgi:hypothetical protein
VLVPLLVLLLLVAAPAAAALWVQRAALLLHLLLLGSHLLPLLLWRCLQTERHRVPAQVPAVLGH